MVIGILMRLLQKLNEKLDDNKMPENAVAKQTGNENVPKDEEGFGKAGQPAATGQPRDPANAASKRKSWIVLLMAGFAMAIDFTMALMSIQALYYALNGPPRLYGLTFGAYDLTGMLFSPVFGMWSDRTGTFKLPISVGALVNICGNVIYAFCFLASAWWMMLLGRLIAGVGGATLSLGSGWIARCTSFENRQVSLMYYRVSQSLARMVGPFVGYFFLGLPPSLAAHHHASQGLPYVNENSSTGLKVFNWYTSPGWVAAAVVALFSVIFWILFIDPTKENEHLIDHSALNPASGDASDDPLVIARRSSRFRSFVFKWLFLAGFQNMMWFAFYSTLFSLFAGQYHAVNSQSDQWKVFIGVAIGAASAGLTYRRAIRMYPAIFNERILAAVSNWMMFVVYMLVIPYHGEQDTPPHAIYYAATGIMGASIVIGSAATETFFSKKITQYDAVPFYGVAIRDSIAKWLGTFFMASAAGRFAGPLIAGAALRIATPSGVVNYCPNGWTVDEQNDPICAAPTDTACAITADYYFTDGCILHGATVFYSVFAVLQFLACLGNHWVLYTHWSYSE